MSPPHKPTTFNLGMIRQYPCRAPNFFSYARLFWCHSEVKSLMSPLISETLFPNAPINSIVFSDKLVCSFMLLTQPNLAQHTTPLSALQTNMANILLLTSPIFSSMVQIMDLLEKQQLRVFTRNISKATILQDYWHAHDSFP